MELQELSVTEVGSKAKSKGEIYRLLATEGGIYLPPLKDVNYQFLRDIITGSKKYIKGNQIKHKSVPFFKDLTVEKIFEFAEPICRVSEFLPEVKEKLSFWSREWFCNIVNTLCEKEFASFISDALKTREEYLLKKKDLKVIALPEFVKLFKNSRTTSHETGRSHYLIRKCKKRKYYEMEDDEKDKMKKEIEKYQRSKTNLENEIINLNCQIDDLYNYKKLSEDNSSKLADLYNKGIIDEDGKPL